MIGVPLLHAAFSLQLLGPSNPDRSYSIRLKERANAGKAMHAPI